MSSRKPALRRSQEPIHTMCGWGCKTDIPPTGYWRAFDPSLPAGAFMAVCGEDCPNKPPGAEVIERAGAKR